MTNRADISHRVTGLFIRWTALPFLVAASSLYAETALADYTPRAKVSGTIRNWGTPFHGLVEAWEKDFAKYQPRVKFDDKFPSSDGWSAGLESGIADIGTSGREVMLVEYLSFSETFGYNPTEIEVATGAYDLKGKTWAIVLYVNKDNPLEHLTMPQVDGIFGAERTGALVGLKWMPQYARGPEKNIRTWGQLGLTGEWADKPIQTYGYAFTGMTNFFQIKVFHGGDKWNPNYKQYVEYGTPMVSEGEIGLAGDSKHMLTEGLAKDKYGIGWSGVEHTRDVPGVKPIALAAQEGGPYVSASKASVQNRTYPLSRSIFMYIKHPPGQPVDPKIAEFLRYILSKQGQEVVEKLNIYLPLTPQVAASQLKKIE